MQAIVVTIGDEILIGQIVDTNSTYISKKLYSAGVDVLKNIAVKDNATQIKNTLDKAFEEVDLLIITGGLGPTKDDLTKKVLSEYFNDKLEYNENAMLHIKSIFSKMRKKMPKSNKEQAMLPTKAKLLHNQFGTALGMVFSKKNKIAISLPGVPFEMKNMMENAVIPYITKKYTTENLIHKTVLTHGLVESELTEKIRDWENKLDDIKLAYLPSPGRVRLRLSIKGKNKKELTKRIDKEIEKLKKIIGNAIYGYGEETIESVIAKLLTNKKKTICTAESFTGGRLSSMLTSISGSSKYFKGAVVSYASQSKIDILGVEKTSIENNTVVSKQVAKEMAENSRKMFHADYSIATVGVAGPNKGEDGKDLGTAVIAIATNNNTIVEEFNFGQPREKMLGRAIATAFNMLKEELNNTDIQTHA